MLLKDHSTPEEAAQLVQMLGKLHPLNKELQKFVVKHSFPCKLGRGKLLLKPGEICTHIYFVKSGVLRGYLTDNSKDITTWITAENEMAAAISSFVYQVEAFENIQAIEDCELLAVAHADIEKAYKKYPAFNIIARKIFERYYVDAENRALISRLKNAERKYEFFLNIHSQLANRVPLKYIASYMGITIETLSRLRSKKASIKKNR